MKIAVVAWGSLLWKPAPLHLASGWHPGGPLLALEFCRVSEDTPELALALCPGARLCPTYWAWLDTGDLEAARAMLRAREKITPERPEWVGTVPAAHHADAATIDAWRRARGIDAAVWTALPPRFRGQDGRVPDAHEVLQWLATRSGDEGAAAQHYIRRTPAHIDTGYRRLIEARLGWRPLREAHVTRMP
ncbi:hypothetical protein [Pseudoduganella chitinolytica]|uniref:Uncharacterized protein n=1 Tax=Pseudoduganella chitinolytica TaxID=34070 RepID=A0ABY8BJP1_9BURK|nr:hypothetical protein [Pseudoduganella chitinolytica]WEF34464.1 hypothetical protein PX653_06760 [Pseudoduganella chitinolytica]